MKFENTISALWDESFVNISKTTTEYTWCQICRFDCDSIPYTM